MESLLLFSELGDERDKPGDISLHLPEKVELKIAVRTKGMEV